MPDNSPMVTVRGEARCEGRVFSIQAMVPPEAWTDPQAARSVVDLVRARLFAGVTAECGPISPHLYEPVLTVTRPTPDEEY